MPLRDAAGVVPLEEFVWALGSLCGIHGQPFSAELVAREFPAPCQWGNLLEAAPRIGLRMRARRVAAKHVPRLAFPLLARLHPGSESPALGENHSHPQIAIVTQSDDDGLVLYYAGSNQPKRLTLSAFAVQFEGTVWLSAPAAEPLQDPDARASMSGRFGFRWFVPELLKHRKVWRDVLLASAALQCIALATPLFTQTIIDKVVVHRTESTLIAIGVAMLIFTVFNSLLSWVRQYLVLHTGNRVDAVLGAAVWEHLLRLPLRYFEHRPTGVVAARMHGVETIREFISGAAVSLILDFPFLVICLAVMFWYSPLLTCVVLAILGVIGVMSAVVAPIFQARLNEQFLLGARNQAFLTEHIAGFETVKSLQMEPQLRKRYSNYLAVFLQSGFKTKQIANTYNVVANTLEQTMTLLVLMMGAYIVMREPSFTIGMLVAFQMFSGKLSQPVLRIVGLWSQFQQAKLSVDRLGDLMNSPVEPYNITPQRQSQGAGVIDIEGLAFRYAEDRPLLYEALSLKIEPGKSMAIMGPSGSGKSTLAKLLLGFYQPTNGAIRIDGVDIRNLSANELRQYFGVVPQETTLFSGTILQNLCAGNPGARFDQVVQACKMAGIHAVVEALPQGYETEVGERGVGLSGGQKQRLAIARALLKGPKVLIFDEATSALDGDTAESFARTINALKGQVTMLFITHALPKSLKIDEVLVLNKEGAHQLRALTPAPAHRPDSKEA